MNRLLRAAAIAIAGGALFSCKSVPTAPVVTPPPAPVVPLDTRVSWILRLEQQRILRDPDLPPLVGSAMGLAPARTPDLRALLLDLDGSVRRRAALAIGRVGSVDGVAPLARALDDGDADVRASAAFALGLIGAHDGIAPLQAALKDASPLVRGRAAEGLGLIGD